MILSRCVTFDLRKERLNVNAASKRSRESSLTDQLNG